jgi:signal transduction histidine kinase
MATDATGAAFIDRTGTVVVADVEFTSRLGLPRDPGGDALRRRAESDPALRQLLAGDARAAARVAGAGGAPVDVERMPAGDGAFLLVRDLDAGERLEHAVRSEALPRIAAGLAHDIKNPLNAMALQIALLSEKLDGASGQGTVAAHLSAIREQIGRVNEVVRRLLDVADPSAPLGFTDVGALVSDAVGLFAHEARRRRIEVTLDAPFAMAATRRDPARLGRLIVGLVAGAMTSTPDGGRLAVRVTMRDGTVELTMEHPSSDPEPGARYDRDVAASAARALGGSLAVVRDGGSERIMVRLAVSE